jgi:hypothetical protein
LEIDSIAKICGVIVPILVATIKHLMEKRPKVLHYFGHISSFHITQPQQGVVFAHSLIVFNSGRKVATNIRISHGKVWSLLNVSVTPAIDYKIETNPQGEAEIVFSRLVPREQVTISYLYPPTVNYSQVHGQVKSDDGFSKRLDVLPTPQQSKVVSITMLLLMALGLGLVSYWMAQIFLRYTA